MHLIGVQGMPRRVADYPEQFAGWNLFISLRVVRARALDAGVRLQHRRARGAAAARAVANPWRALTLEWQVSSPPPIFNFDAVPTVVGGPYEYGVPGAVHGIFQPRGAGGATTHAGGRPVEPRDERRQYGCRHYLVLANETIGGAQLLDAIRERAAKGDAHFHVVVPLDPPAPRQRDLRRGGARRRAGARRPGARVHARRGDRGHRRGRRPGPVQRGHGRDARAPDRRDHRLDAAGLDLGLAAARPDRAAPGGHRAARSTTSCSRRSSAEGLPFDVTLVLANQTVAGERARAARSRSWRRRGPAPLHRRRAAGLGRRAARCARRASGCDTLLESLRSEHIVVAGMIGDPDPYTAAMNAVQYFHISEIVISTLPERRVRSGWPTSWSSASRARAASRSSTSRPRRRRGLMEAGAVAAAHAPRHATTSTTARRGQPLLARRAPAARDAAFHHLRGHGLRGLLHGLLLHPGRERRRVAGRRAPSCRS